MNLVSASIAGEQRTLMRSISWQAYEMLADTPDRVGQLLNYDRGELEIMSPSHSHELDKSLLGRMVEAFSLHHEIDIRTSASTTFKRQDLNRGFEADESYYVSNELAIREKREVDLLVDPPPDLVIEIERSKSALDKLALFAAMGVPEVWRYNGKSLWLGRLSAGKYSTISDSLELPRFPVIKAVEILQAVGSASETTLIRRFVNSLSKRN